MKGSKNSAILFLFAGILLILQSAISGLVFDDGIGALAAGGFAFVMFIEMGMAYKGGLSAVMDQTVFDTPGWRTVTTRDTGQRIQATPCCGACIGIATIAVTALFSAGLGEAILFLAPGFLAGVIAILASIVFAVEYKGPWTERAF
ncbi:MAG: hypothetical protein GF309_05220 [Candidatus Lokiarchaeota archaeon]|nr:hypothetical protein [Candidatus Lokiarchaeota archaeon]